VPAACPTRRRRTLLTANTCHKITLHVTKTGEGSWRGWDCAPGVLLRGRLQTHVMRTFYETPTGGGSWRGSALCARPEWNEKCPTGIPACPNKFIKMFLKILDIPKLRECMSQTGPKKQRFLKDVPNCVPLKIPKVWVPKASQRSFSIPSQNHWYPKHVPNRLPNSISRCYRWMRQTCHTSALYCFVCLQHDMTVRTQYLHLHDIT
jgi:hypothetical protein